MQTYRKVVIAIWLLKKYVTGWWMILNELLQMEKFLFSSYNGNFFSEFYGKSWGYNIGYEHAC